MVIKKQNFNSLDLWEKFTKTIAPIKSDKITPTNMLDNHPKKTVSKFVTRSAGSKGLPNKPKSLKNRDLNVKTTTPSDLRYEDSAGMDGASSKKLRAGKFDIEATLDLHGMTQQSAYVSLRRFIQTSVTNQFRTILVITGKGTGGKGILRNQFPEWLKSEGCAPHVLAFGQAQARDGGSGAFYIRLRRNRVARK